MVDMRRRGKVGGVANEVTGYRHRVMATSKCLV